MPPRSITRPVSLSIEQPTVSPGSFTASATTRIDRAEFGVTAYRGLLSPRAMGDFLAQLITQADLGTPASSN